MNVLKYQVITPNSKEIKEKRFVKYLESKITLKDLPVTNNNIYKNFVKKLHSIKDNSFFILIDEGNITQLFIGLYFYHYIKENFKSHVNVFFNYIEYDNYMDDHKNNMTINLSSKTLNKKDNILVLDCNSKDILEYMPFMDKKVILKYSILLYLAFYSMNPEMDIISYRIKIMRMLKMLNNNEQLPYYISEMMIFIRINQDRLLIDEYDIKKNILDYFNKYIQKHSSKNLFFKLVNKDYNTINSIMNEKFEVRPNFYKSSTTQTIKVFEDFSSEDFKNRWKITKLSEFKWFIVRFAKQYNAFLSKLKPLGKNNTMPLFAFENPYILADPSKYVSNINKNPYYLEFSLYGLIECKFYGQEEELYKIDKLIGYFKQFENNKIVFIIKSV